VINSYLTNQQQISFIELAKNEIENKPAIEAFFQQWLKPLPRLNYRIKAIERSKATGGNYNYKIDFIKDGPQSFFEPVHILVKDASGNIKIYDWFAAGDKHRIEIDNSPKIKVVHIDPAHRSLDRRLVDNRSPSEYKFILTAFNFAVDFNDSALQAFVATQVRKRHGGNNRYNFAFSVDETNFGFSVGYSRLFGALIDKLRLNHGLGVGYSFNVLDSDFLIVNGQSISPSGNSTKLSVRYGFGNRIAFFNPHKGVGASISFTTGLKALGGDINFFRSSMGYVQIVPINPQHLLAFRSTFGIAGGANIPPQEQFILGGIGSLRGFASSTLNLIGRNHLQANIEYRHSYLYDLDFNLFHIARVRKIQGAFFADCASVTDTVLDELVSGRVQDDFNVGGIFDSDNFTASVGWGIRLFYDALGVRTQMLRFDIATPAYPDFDFDPVFVLSAVQQF
jgi:hypothetical protein